MTYTDVTLPNRYESFFEEYSRLSSEYWTDKRKQEIKQFDSFKLEYFKFRVQFNQLLSSESPDFNIFEILNIYWKEVQLHTPFLFHLLNPKSSHHQGSLFLDEFLSRILESNISYENMRLFRIHKELNTGNGSIDLFIEFNYNQVHHQIVIENKIWAPDQDQQLIRYYSFAKSRRSHKESLIKLVYLTRLGSAPPEHSLEGIFAGKLRQSKVFVELGYYNNIIPWLDSCLPKIHSETVKDTVKQYIQSIEMI